MQRYMHACMHLTELEHLQMVYIVTVHHYAYTTCNTMHVYIVMSHIV